MLTLCYTNRQFPVRLPPATDLTPPTFALATDAPVVSLPLTLSELSDTFRSIVLARAMACRINADRTTEAATKGDDRFRSSC